MFLPSWFQNTPLAAPQGGRNPTEGAGSGLDKYIIAPCAFSVYADGNFISEQNARERGASKLTSLISIEYIRLAIFFDHLFQGFDTKVSLHPDRYTMGENPV